MRKRVALLLTFGIFLGLGAFLIGPTGDREGRSSYTQVAQIEALFPSTPKDITHLVNEAEQKVKRDLEKMYSVSNLPTFSLIFDALDRAMEHCKIAQSSLYVISLSAENTELREAAQEGLCHLQRLFIDSFSLNKKLYKLCSSYVERLEKYKHEELTDEQLYFMDHVIRDFKRSGLNLSDDKQKRISDIQKKRTELMVEYDQFFNHPSKPVRVTREALAGLEESFIATLSKTTNGLYELSTSNDKFFAMMEQCSVSSTRKKLYELFMNRGYPQNVTVLKNYIALSDELAQILGYPSYAHFSLEEEMAKTPERVKEFLETLYSRSCAKAMDELARITKDLPQEVICQEGKLQPWDLTYAFGVYKKKHLQLNESEIASYFPLEHTLESLFKLYEDFFGVCFKKVPGVHFWHESVRSYAVYKKGKYIGMLILDIHPRPHKFSHAGQVTVVPAVKTASHEIFPAVVVIFANVPQDLAGVPATLSRQDVRTLFHECGHALHAFLGATHFASLSGTETKADFVEMPSQMLEEWMWDPEILSSISSHVSTGKPLPKNIIANIVRLKNFEIGDAILRQIFLAEVSLAFYMPGKDKDIAALWKALHEKWRPTLCFDKSNRGFCSFPHIMSYGPRYYGYLWSKIFALDLFYAIKSHGLRNNLIGTRYIDTILAKGGSEDPNSMMTAFLGRPYSSDAFFKDCQL